MTERLFAPLDEFKERELEIIQLMADGLSNQEIADQLFITKGTVRWYNKQIYSKLGTSRRTEAIAVAREMGLIGNVQAEPTASHRVQHKLPVTTGPFIGRDAELAELLDLFANPDVRLVSLIGTGGMGKSRLSLELGHLIKGNFEHGAAFIDLTPVRNPDDIAKFAVASLGLSVSGKQSPNDVLFDYCREKELLLIFDNFEDVVSGARLLSDILEVAPKVTLIASSRERLNLRAETVFYLQPVTENADRLFIEVANMMRPNIEIAEDELEDIQHIVELTGGLPLGLVLAATWVDTLSIAEIAEEIERNLDFLSAEMGDMPERQRSIHAVIEPTWQRLNEKEQKAFVWVSVFRGGFTRETFQQVTGASVRTIQNLLNRSLIGYGYGRRYDMHPLLRQYAREQLEHSGQFDEAKKAHLAAFLAYAQTQRERMYNGHYLESLEALDIEQDNFRVGLDWSFLGNETETGVALLTLMSRFWLDRSQIQEAIHYLELALDYQHDALLYMQLGICQYRMGQVDAAEDNIQQAIRLAHETQSLAVLANSYRMLALLQQQRKPIQDIQSLLDKALDYAEASKNPLVIANCLGTNSLFLMQIGEPIRTVLEYAQKELDIREAQGDLQGVSRTIYNMSLEYYHLGETDYARELCERSLSLKRQIGDTAGIARRLSVLATWDMMEEEFERAGDYLAESLSLARTLGEQSRLRYALAMQGVLHMIMGDYDKSEEYLEDALALAIALKQSVNITNCQSYLALIFLLQGQFERALPYIQQAIALIHDTGNNPEFPMISYANYLWYQGNYTACTPLVAILHLQTEQGERRNIITDKYFVYPLIYRVQQHLGEDAWQAALDAAAETSIEALFQEIVAVLDEA